MGDSGLAKLKITAYADGDFKKPLGEPYLVMINPDRYSHGYEIRYTDPQAQGSSGGSPRFNRMAAETVTFEIVFDGTGVVPAGTGGSGSSAPNVTKQIDLLKGLVFDYSGTMHSPKFLTLAWGTLLFHCRLTSLDLTYTLFRPDGTPLRATARTAFIGYSDEGELARAANKSSPDLTHELIVRAGDTLPLLCWNVYGSSACYLAVARANGLSGFRALAPGTRLVFPPLGRTSS